MLTIDDHPCLDLVAFRTTFPRPIGQLPTPDWLRDLAAVDAPTPLDPPDDAVRGAVRRLLRHGGFKPSGRSKPCAEYIRKVAEEGAFPEINAPVDATNVACVHGGLPVSTVDLDRLAPPLRVGIAAPGTAYVFNASGQVIDVSGLLCLFDAEGPCANAVKDAQRAKTTPESERVLTIVWGTTELPGRADRVGRWLRELMDRLGGETIGT